MTASIDECVAAFSRTQVCTDRVYSRLLKWAAYITALPLPPTDAAPEKAWVQQRVLAERVPPQATFMVVQLCPYLLEVPNIANDIRTHLNAYNDEATETGLATEIDNAMAVVMPEFAAISVSDAEVAMWCDKNGYPRPPDLVGAPPPPGTISPASVATPATPPGSGPTDPSIRPAMTPMSGR